MTDYRERNQMPEYICVSTIHYIFWMTLLRKCRGVNHTLKFPEFERNYVEILCGLVDCMSKDYMKLTNSCKNYTLLCQKNGNR